jgi:hypothetical protein
MKILLAASVLMLPAQAIASNCPDLTGKYQETGCKGV